MTDTIRFLLFLFMFGYGLLYVVRGVHAYWRLEGKASFMLLFGIILSAAAMLWSALAAVRYYGGW